MFQVRIKPSREFYFIIKRLFDLALAVFLSIALSPFLVLIALIIKLESEGPVLFKQTRVGLHSKRFTIYKFRSMFISAPVNSPTRDLKNPGIYLTRSGRILRLLSIDELPQLLNVIKNDMSLIGPRPVIPQEAELIKMRHELGIDMIKPGVTGLAQVFGRDYLNDNDKASFDYQYMQTMSLWVDLKILVFTALKIIKREHILH